MLMYFYAIPLHHNIQFEFTSKSLSIFVFIAMYITIVNFVNLYTHRFTFQSFCFNGIFVCARGEHVDGLTF